jgi:uncharacterized cupredoxin-like copper-binding protein
MRARTPRVLATLAGFALLVASCGGGGGGSSSGGYKPPSGPSTETITVHAGNFYFKPDTLTATAGIATIDLVSDGGVHTFVFDNAYSGFQLEVSGAGDSQKQKIDLKPGKYTFYCNIPGHRSQGMQGTLTVS